MSTTTKKAATAEEQAATPPLTYYYRYDLVRLPLNPLERFDPLLLMEADEQSYLDHYQYHPHPVSGAPDLVHYFKSLESSAVYLAIVLVGVHRFVIHIADDRALREWRQQYERNIEMFPSIDGVLPELPGGPYMNHKLIKLDARAVRLNNGFY